MSREKGFGERKHTALEKKRLYLNIQVTKQTSIFHIVSSRELYTNPCSYHLPRCLFRSPQTTFFIQVAVKHSAISPLKLPKGTEEIKVTIIVTR